MPKIDIMGVSQSVSDMQSQSKRKKKFDLDTVLNVGTKIAGAVASTRDAFRPSSNRSESSSTSAPSQNNQGYAPPPPTPKDNTLLYVGLGIGLVLILGIGFILVKK